MLQTLMSWLQAHLAPPTGRAVTGLMCGMQHSKEAMQARGREDVLCASGRHSRWPLLLMTAAAVAA